MSRDGSLYLAERVLAAAAVVVGWAVALDQLIRDGWGAGGGTGWLVLFALIASAGLVVLLITARDAHGMRALALAAVAVSPTVFAYVLNVVVVALALIELAFLARDHGFAARTHVRSG